ncbi:transporter [Vibrio sp. SM6]|uniref:Transporter n=1 Tax=Vibrio agarilyticus TaxID=2726741 RepID=A0A7X8TMA5_9VIBR|nr:transporter [Vibrio agarilyticus]NLS11358.1 transporter [Vibrio agarilyticus]
MEEYGKNSIEFDYAHFLGASCNKRWTFMEALETIAPVFTVIWKSNLVQLATPEERLWENALKTMSLQQSDESNLVTLLQLAQTEGFDELRVAMPYGLDPEQVEYIQSRCGVVLEWPNGDGFTVQLASPS